MYYCNAHYKKDSVSRINKEYKLEYYVEANWYNAYLFCRNNGMKLATVTSQEEHDYLSALILESGAPGPWWISGTDLGKENLFSWFSEGELIKYTNWDVDEPNNVMGDEHCLAFNRNHKRNDDICTKMMNIICET